MFAVLLVILTILTPAVLAQQDEILGGRSKPAICGHPKTGH